MVPPRWKRGIFSRGESTRASAPPWWRWPSSTSYLRRWGGGEGGDQEKLRSADGREDGERVKVRRTSGVGRTRRDDGLTSDEGVDKTVKYK